MSVLLSDTSVSSQRPRFSIGRFPPSPDVYSMGLATERPVPVRYPARVFNWQLTSFNCQLKKTRGGARFHTVSPLESCLVSGNLLAARLPFIVPVTRWRRNPPALAGRGFR